MIPKDEHHKYQDQNQIGDRENTFSQGLENLHEASPRPCQLKNTKETECSKYRNVHTNGDTIGSRGQGNLYHRESANHQIENIEFATKSLSAE